MNGEDEMTGMVSEIKRMAIHDGDGLRTTVFLKGCPMRCVWCHNPESLSPLPQIRLIEEKCVGCGLCAEFCHAHRITEGRHTIDPALCSGCGKCAPHCPHGAILHNGTPMSVEQVVAEVMEDLPFYQVSGGGVTLSGGEPLMQSKFAVSILRRLKEEGVSTALETCGFVSRSILEETMDVTDIYLYDIKALNETVHIRCTGQSNRVILNNLRWLDSRKKRIEIRIPYVPGYNDGEIGPIGDFLAGLDSICRVRVLPYHALARSKYRSLGMEYSLQARIPEPEEIDRAVELLKGYGVCAVSGYA